MFDIGTGKSQFLKFAAKLSNRSVITTGLGSTSAGLTVTAVKDGGKFPYIFFTATDSFSLIHTLVPFSIFINYLQVYQNFYFCLNSPLAIKATLLKCSSVNCWDFPF